MELMSPRSTQPYHTLLSGPRTTFAITVAFFATKAARAVSGVLPRCRASRCGSSMGPSLAGDHAAPSLQTAFLFRRLDFAARQPDYQAESAYGANSQGGHEAAEHQNEVDRVHRYGWPAVLTVKPDSCFPARAI